MPEPSFEGQVAAALGKLYDWQLAGRVADALVEAAAAAAMKDWDWREAALKALKGDA